MRTTILVLLVVVLGAGLGLQGPPVQDIAVYFSPKGGATDAIVRELAGAKTDIKMLAYSFTSAPIAEALMKAHARGVKVTVLLDDSNERDQYTVATYLTNHKMPVLIDSKHALAHNKILIIDGATVITGSFNFTKAAEDSNAENLLVIKRPDVAMKYLANFTEHEKHSRAYRR